MSGDEDFLSRWSRRKRAPEVDVAPEPGPEPEVEPEVPVEIASKSEAEILEELGLTDPDLLGPGDDFRGFMRAAVPEHLRRRALRKLWVSNPVLANLDGLNDYDDDFTGGSVGPGMLKTAYKVGRGIVRDVAEAVDLPRKAEVTVSGESSDESPTSAEPCEISEPAETSETVAEEGTETAKDVPRRMRFRFEG